MGLREQERERERFDFLNLIPSQDRVKAKSEREGKEGEREGGLELLLM